MTLEDKARLRPGRSRGPVALPALRRRSVYIVAAGVWLTGLGWVVSHFLLSTRGEFGPQENPATAWWLRAHGLFAFASVWSLGLLWGVHVLNGWSSGRLRGSGAGLFGAGLLLTGTGYALYYLGDDATRGAASYVHWVVGIASLLLFLWHRRWLRRP